MAKKAKDHPSSQQIQIPATNKGTSHKRKRQKSRPQPEAILTRPAEGNNFADVLGRVRTEVSPIDSEVNVKALRNTLSGNVLVELPETKRTCLMMLFGLPCTGLPQFTLWSPKRLSNCVTSMSSPPSKRSPWRLTQLWSIEAKILVSRANWRGRGDGHIYSRFRQR